MKKKRNKRTRDGAGEGKGGEGRVKKNTYPWLVRCSVSQKVETVKKTRGWVESEIQGYKVENI